MFRAAAALGADAKGYGMYKETLNLPATQFPMRADAARREPERLQRWENDDLYGRLRAARAGAPRFLLHDGPPYANEHIHLGTAFNKILKDFVVRSRAMLGYDVPFVPGWDCHGLPIEQKVDRELGGRKLAMTDLEVRAACRDYAERFVAVQREEFRRLGGIGTWYNPYLTMAPRYEADIAAALGKVIEQGLLYRERKAIRWCWQCKTALAEAELEYASRRDPEITVAFPAADPAAVRAAFGAPGRNDVAFAIWTTTPWTIPSNLAIAVHPDAEYVLVDAERGGLVMAAALAPSVLAAAGLQGREAGRAKGTALLGLAYRHPLAPGWRAVLPEGAKAFVIVAADYVTLDTGTGLVHTAPGHGEDDFRTGKVEGIPVVSPLDDGGRYTAEVADLKGVHVFDATPRVTEALASAGALLASGAGEHEYPHCWRCHNPVIFRATEQYFIALTPGAAPHARIDLRQRALEEIDKVSWLPQWGQARIRGMVENRFEWCVSRQRRWGSPITVLVCTNESCKSVWPDGADGGATRAFFARVEERFAAEGADAWYARPVSDFAPAGLVCPKCGGTAWEKERDILDVWFDSGASHLAVCDNGRFPGMSWPADLYLEAHDQYRGWFQSSLLVAVGHHADEERRLEPTTVLVVRLEVEVRGPGHSREPPVVAHGKVRRARVEPDVEDVALLLPRRAAALGAHEAGGRKVGDRTRVPRVRALGGEPLLDAGEEGARRPAVRAVRPHRLARLVGADEHRDRRAPAALPRHAPLEPVLDHPADAGLPPLRQPRHLVDFLEGALPQVDPRVRGGAGGERDEVLLGRAEDHGVVAAPAVRVLVLSGSGREERARACERLGDPRGGVEDVHPLEVRDLGRVAAAVVERRDDRDPLDLAGAEIILAVAGRGVHQAGAGIEGDVVGRDDHERLGALGQDGAPPGRERVPVRQAEECGPLGAAGLPPLQPGGGEHRRGERRRHHQPAALSVNEHVLGVGVHRDREVGRDRPRCRRPDRERDIVPAGGAERRAHGGRIGGGERDGDFGVAAGGVLEFGLGEGCLALPAPADRLALAVEQPLLDDLAEGGGDVGLVARRHGEVRVVPGADPAETAEFLALHGDYAERTSRLRGAHLQVGHRELAAAQFAVDLLLDGETVAVPARDERDVVTEHGARAHDEILENLVERRPEVNVLVGVGRAVVEEEAGRTGARRAQASVEIVVLPPLQPLRLAARGVA